MNGETRKQIDELLEKAAHLMADANAVEAAWFLRGVTDGLAGHDPQPPADYRGVYHSGFKSGQRQSNISGGF